MSESETYYVVAGSKLKGIADAIRAQGGTEEGLSFPDGFETAIGNLSKVVTRTFRHTSSTNRTLTFEELPKDPEAFVVYVSAMSASSSSGSGNKQFSGVVYNGTDMTLQYTYCYRGASSSSAYIASSGEGFEKAYSNGTLTITLTDTNYKLTVGKDYFLVAFC